MDELGNFDELFNEEFDEEVNSGEVTLKLPKPHPGQREVLNSKARFKVMMCGRRWGKTLLLHNLSIQAMLEGKKVAYVTPGFDLGKDFFREIQSYLPNAIIKTNNSVSLFIELVTGGSLKFFSGEAIDSFRGRKYHLVLIDEAAKIPDLQNAWKGAIRPTLADYKGEAVFVSTPRGRNFFYSLFLKGQNKEDGFHSWHFPSSSNPYLPKGEVETAEKEAKGTFEIALFKEEWLAEPMGNSSNPFDAEAIERNTIEVLSTKTPVVYGIDLASVGDYTVIIGLDEDGVMSYFDRFQLPWEQTMNKIIALGDTIMKVVDSTGVGDVVFGALISKVGNIFGFKFTSSSKPAIINSLINDVSNNAVKFNKTTADELSVFEFHRMPSGHIRFEAQTGFHDDCVCALAIANHHKYSAITNKSFKFYTMNDIE